MKNKRKGFTIVELVIVIAVIAILAAAMVPKFTGVMTKVYESVDLQTIKMMNTYVQMDLVERGESRHNTMYAAIEACDDRGLRPDKISAKSDLNIAWQSSTSKFVLVDVINKTYRTTDGEFDIINQTDFFIVSTYEESQNLEGTSYSIYAYGNDWPKEITVHGGFDGGEISSIKKIYYSPLESTNEEIIINTNIATKLYFDGDDNTVIKHYGCGGYTYINHVKEYHEYGNTFKMELIIGHIIAETGSRITAVYDLRESSVKEANPNFIDIKDEAEVSTIHK